MYQLIHHEGWRARQTRLAEEDQQRTFNRRLQYLIIWLPALAVVGYYLLYLFEIWANSNLPTAI